MLSLHGDLPTLSRLVSKSQSLNLAHYTVTWLDVPMYMRNVHFLFACKQRLNVAAWFSCTLSWGRSRFVSPMFRGLALCLKPQPTIEASPSHLILPQPQRSRSAVTPAALQQQHLPRLVVPPKSSAVTLPSGRRTASSFADFENALNQVVVAFAKQGLVWRMSGHPHLAAEVGLSTSLPLWQIAKLSRLRSQLHPYQPLDGSCKLSRFGEAPFQSFSSPSPVIGKAWSWLAPSCLALLLEVFVSHCVHFASLAKVVLLLFSMSWAAKSWERLPLHSPLHQGWSNHCLQSSRSGFASRAVAEPHGTSLDHPS